MERDALVDRLLLDLKDEDKAIRERATARLWEYWFQQKGAWGFERLRQARVLSERGDVAAAEVLLSEVVRDLPDFAEAWNQRAILHYSLKRYERSHTDCQQVVRLVPYHFGAWHGLGLCHMALGDYRAAIEALNQALTIQPYGMLNQRLILECTLQINA